MNAATLGERTLSELDFCRLAQLRGADAPGELAELLGGAEVVQATLVPSDVVAMYAQVDLRDVATGRRHRFVLCYPGQTEPREGYISVLSPIGMALIGLRVGSIACWESPTGLPCRARVMAVSRIAQFTA
ncbi:GreA/GreB family elongation factor [Ramlibacter alkalitolerans]|uniref:GreA/GreB family elongation factor n=1 Tax=Ramlibacter alkalitolerans TaxID=2039631 RepID=A0ABS1JLV7_9BURK|nr:GreA/GreB family elongation factor [Ramlibacter alkalitolerans]MBL0425210.1 GreA/GreB family elongation factor [Ramlibacter alkalitolerans]